MKKLTDYINQVGNLLVAEKDCSLTLNLEKDYELNEDVVLDEENNMIWLKSVIGKLEFNNFSFDLVLDYPVNLFAENMEIKKKEYIKLEYKKEDNILEIVVGAVEMRSRILYLNRLLSGKELYKDPGHLLMKIYTIFKDESKMDFVHFEVLLGNCLRDANDISIAARLAKEWNPIVLNIKDMVHRKGSFLQSLSFEDTNKSIRAALITSEGKKDRTILEKVLLGEMVD